MAKKAAKDINFSYNAVALEGSITSIEQRVTQELPVVTGLSDVGPQRVVGNYDFGYSLDGPDDFAAGGVDATLFGGIGDSDGGATAFDPTGETAGASDPNYDASSCLVENYNIKGAVGAGVTYSATLQGNSELQRNVA